MPDNFFTSSKSRKRKRPPTTPRQNGFSKNHSAKKPSKKTKLDEELSEQESSEEWGGIADMDLRTEDPDPGESGDEDEDETPAEKRLRLAHMYLDNIKESLGTSSHTKKPTHPKISPHFSRRRIRRSRNRQRIDLFTTKTRRPRTFRQSPSLYRRHLLFFPLFTNINIRAITHPSYTRSPVLSNFRHRFRIRKIPLYSW